MTIHVCTGGIVRVKEGSGNAHRWRGEGVVRYVRDGWVYVAFKGETLLISFRPEDLEWAEIPDIKWHPIRVD